MQYFSLRWPLYTRTHLPVAQSHSRMVLSSVEARRYLPLGVKRTMETGGVSSSAARGKTAGVRPMCGVAETRGHRSRVGQSLHLPIRVFRHCPVLVSHIRLTRGGRQKEVSCPPPCPHRHRHDKHPPKAIVASRHDHGAVSVEAHRGHGVRVCRHDAQLWQFGCGENTASEQST